MSEEKKPSGFGKMNLKDATNKVNAEALRQFQIDAEGIFPLRFTCIHL